MSMPIVNLNGDNSATLIKQQYAVIKAAQALLKAMREASPHGRNYQCNPDGDYYAAYKQHAADTRSVVAVEERANATLEDLMRQHNERYGDRAYEMIREVLHGDL